MMNTMMIAVKIWTTGTMMTTRMMTAVKIWTTGTMMTTRMMTAVKIWTTGTMPANHCRNLSQKEKIQLLFILVVFVILIEET